MVRAELCDHDVADERSSRAIASGSPSAAWYTVARLLSVFRVPGWSGPSLVITASRTRSSRAIALGLLADELVRRGEVAESAQGIGVVGAELADFGVADALVQGDCLGQLAGGLVCQGEIVEPLQGFGVVGAELGDHAVAVALEQGNRLGELAGGLVRLGEAVERGKGVAVVAAELGGGGGGGGGGDPGVADALEQDDRLGDLADRLVRHGEVVERGQSVGVVGA